MREKLLEKLAHWQYTRTRTVLGIFLVLTIIMGFLAGQLKTTMRWSDLLPENDPRTIEFDHVINEFSTASSIVVVVQGEEHRIKSFADAVVPKIKKVVSPHGEQMIKRVDYKQEMDFIKNHALMLMKKSDLENSMDMFLSPNLDDFITNLNNSLEKEYVGKQESISSREKRDRAIYFMNGLKSWIQNLNEILQSGIIEPDRTIAAIDKLLLGDPYFLSYDESVLIINVIPTFSSVDLDKVIYTVNEVEKLIKNSLKEYPGVHAGLTGTLALSRDEMVASQQSLNETSLISLIGILILLAVMFRMWVAPIMALGTLLIGVVWATGASYLTVGMLNIMTSMMAVILFGLGIDFSVHILSAFSEARSKKMTIHDSLNFMYKKAGKGIITGALTTAAAFFCLIVSHSRGMKEMGIVTSLGLIMILLVTFLLLPTLLVMREKRREKKGKIFSSRQLTFGKLGKIAQVLTGHRKIALIIFLALTSVMVYFAAKLEFDYNYLNMEPKGLESIALQDTLLEKFDLSTDYALIVVLSPEESGRLAKKARNLSSVALVEDISQFLPSKTDQDERIPLIRKINDQLSGSKVNTKPADDFFDTLIREFERLEMNIIEIQDLAFMQGDDKLEQKCAELVGSPDIPELKGLLTRFRNKLANSGQAGKENMIAYHGMFAPYVKKLLMQMSNTNYISKDELPVSILERYANREHTKYLVTIYPKNNIWKDIKFLEQFTLDVESVSIRVTGMAPVMQALYDLIGRDGRNALILTLIVVFLLLWADFRNIKLAVLALTPLLAGLIWMMGLMKMFGLMLTTVNVMGLPMILGIGIDDGVHILHRYKEENYSDVFTIFSSTGRAILLTSLTTMVAFGSLIFSIYRGFGSLGAALFLGVGACFLTTLLGLAPMLKKTGNQK